MIRHYIGLALLVGCRSPSNLPNSDVADIKQQLSDLQKVVSNHTVQLEKLGKTGEPQKDPAIMVEVEKSSLPPEMAEEAKKLNQKPDASDLWSDKNLFQKGFELRKENTARAASLFAKLIKKYPESPLADNSLYWLGMMQFEKGEFHAANIFWDKILRDYPRSNKVPEALYHMVLSYQKLQKNDMADLAKNRLLNNHGHSEAAARIMP